MTLHDNSMLNTGITQEWSLYRPRYTPISLSGKQFSWAYR